MVKKRMTTSQYDYQKLYRCFCKELQANPDLRFTRFCEQAGVPWRRLYDWMSRRKVSLKRLYAGVERDLPEDMPATPRPSRGAPPLIPLKIEKADPSNKAMLSDSISVSISLPTGVTVNLAGCSVHDLIAIMGGPLGTGHV